MWYLVVPPIVVVLCLAFLVWYLSRKSDDPAIAEKVMASKEGESTITFPRTKEFFLKILEKSGQHFKVFFLRMHNTLHEFTQSVRASRRKVHTALTTEEEPATVPAPEVLVSVSERNDEVIVERAAPADILSVPIVRRDKGISPNEKTVEVKKESIPRPMVSEVAVHPEKKKRLARPNSIHEEDLIAKIARDPKDFTAYEALGDYYLEMDNIKDAKECYRQVLKLSPVHRMVKIKIRRLEKLLTKAGE